MGNVEIEPSPPLRKVAEINFCAEGNGIAFTRSGFSHPEATHTWGLAPQSVLSFPPSQCSENAIVLIRLNDIFASDTAASSLRILISAAGQPVFDETLSKKTAIGISLPKSRAYRDGFDLVFDYPDAVHPQSVGHPDLRHLTARFASVHLYSAVDEPFGRPPVIDTFHDVAPDRLDEAIRSATGLLPSEVMLGFESLGHSCDFGLAQRELKQEPLGLLRFAGISTYDAVTGVISGWKGIGSRDALEVYLPDGSDEYWVVEKLYGIHSHTFIAPDKAHMDQIIAREAHRLPFLARKFMEDVHNGEKIFVLRRPDEMVEFEAFALWVALNSQRKNSLLFLEQEQTERTGKVVLIRQGFMRGYIDGTPGHVAPNMLSWKSVCANAWLATNSVVPFS